MIWQNKQEFLETTQTFLEQIFCVTNGTLITAWSGMSCSYSDQNLISYNTIYWAAVLGKQQSKSSNFYLFLQQTHKSFPNGSNQLRKRLIVIHCLQFKLSRKTIYFGMNRKTRTRNTQQDKHFDTISITRGDPTNG